MTLKQAEYLLAIARYGSITQAAKNLFVSQSSLSSVLQQIESRYQLEVFKRSSKGIELTMQGREFLEDIQHMLDQFEYIEEKYSKPITSDIQLSISTQHHICGESAFLQLVEKYQSGRFRFSYRECNTEQLLDDVENGTSDIGLLFFYVGVKHIVVQDLRNRGLVFNQLSRRLPHIYVHEQHPLLAHPLITAEDLSTFPSISYDASGSRASLYTATLRRSNPRPQVYYVSDRACAYTLMRHTMAYSLGTGYHSQDPSYRDIVQIPIQGSEEVEIGWIVKGKQQLSSVALEMIDLLKNLCPC